MYAGHRTVSHLQERVHEIQTAVGECGSKEAEATGGKLPMGPSGGGRSHQDKDLEGSYQAAGYYGNRLRSAATSLLWREYEEGCITVSV